MLSGGTKSVKDLATRYGCKQDKILQFIANGELPAINVATNRDGGKPRWRITDEALSRFEQARSTVKPESKSPVRRRSQAGVKQFF